MFNYENHSIESILDCSSKIITFIDLAGSHKYLKTTVFGLTGHCPDYAALVVNSKQGLGSCYYFYIVIAVFTGRVAVLVVLQYWLCCSTGRGAVLVVLQYWSCCSTCCVAVLVVLQY